MSGPYETEVVSYSPMAARNRSRERHRKRMLWVRWILTAEFLALLALVAHLMTRGQP